MSRITVTIDEDTLAEMKERVAPGEVSAFVIEAFRNKLRPAPRADRRCASPRRRGLRADGGHRRDCRGVTVEAI